MLSTLAEAKASGILRIAGVTTGSQQFIDLVNEGTRRLLSRGDWPGTVVPLQCCATRGCAAFPRYVDHVRKINLCNTPIATHSLYWNFMPSDTYDCCTGVPASWLGSECSMTGQGRAPTQMDIWGEGRYVRVYITDIHDVNKRITLFGEDNNGQPYSEVITMGNPGSYVQTQSLVRRIDRVIKDLTVGRVIMVGYYAATGSVEELATYEPSETNPSFLRVNLDIPCTSSCNSTTSSDGTCPQAQPIAALVKLKFIPAIVDTDLVLIENLVALKLMIQSIRCEDANDWQGKREAEANAIRELNLDIWNQGTDAVPVTDDAFNGVSYLGTQQCY